MKQIWIGLVFCGWCGIVFGQSPTTSEIEMRDRHWKLHDTNLELLFELEENPFPEEREEYYSELQPVLEELEEIINENSWTIRQLMNCTNDTFNHLGQYAEPCDVAFIRYCLEVLMRQVQKETTDDEMITNYYEIMATMMGRAPIRPIILAFLMEHRKVFMERYAKNMWIAFPAEQKNA